MYTLLLGYNSNYMKYLLTIALLFCLVACGGEEAVFEGVFNCKGCTYQTLYFSPGGEVVLKSHELEIPAVYTKEENNITIEIETGTYTFVLQKDGSLQGTGDVEGTYSPAKP